MTSFDRTTTACLLGGLALSSFACKRWFEGSSTTDGPAPSAAASSSTKSLGNNASRAATIETPCWMLTPGEVSSVLKLQTVATKLPKAGEYGAPRCQWAPPTDASNPPSIVIAYFGDQGSDVDKYFEDHLETDRKMFKAFHEPISGLGDKAMLFGARLWVKKGDAFFSLTFSGVDWSAAQITPRDAQLKLAKLAVAHMR
jgi:hypothetical protein